MPSTPIRASAVVAERIYQIKFTDGSVGEMRVGLELPECIVYHLDETTGIARSRWECSAYIESASVSKRMKGTGDDSLEALCSALETLMVSINHIAAFTDSDVTYGAESNLLAGILLTVSLQSPNAGVRTGEC